jgi:hypothetical protein
VTYGAIKLTDIHPPSPMWLPTLSFESRRLSTTSDADLSHGTRRSVTVRSRNMVEQPHCLASPSSPLVVQEKVLGLISWANVSWLRIEQLLDPEKWMPNDRKDMFVLWGSNGGCRGRVSPNVSEGNGGLGCPKCDQGRGTAMCTGSDDRTPATSVRRQFLFGHLHPRRRSAALCVRRGRPVDQLRRHRKPFGDRHRHRGPRAPHVSALSSNGRGDRLAVAGHPNPPARS